MFKIGLIVRTTENLRRAGLIARKAMADMFKTGLIVRRATGN